MWEWNEEGFKKDLRISHGTNQSGGDNDDEMMIRWREYISLSLSLSIFLRKEIRVRRVIIIVIVIIGCVKCEVWIEALQKDKQVINSVR